MWLGRDYPLTKERSGPNLLLGPFLSSNMLCSAHLAHHLALICCYLQELIQLQTGDARWGQHAQRVAGGDMWNPPGNGGHDDKAHPPIHPTKYSPGTVLMPAAWGSGLLGAFWLQYRGRSIPSSASKRSGLRWNIWFANTCSSSRVLFALNQLWQRWPVALVTRLHGAVRGARRHQVRASSV